MYTYIYKYIYIIFVELLTHAIMLVALALFIYIYIYTYAQRWETLAISEKCPPLWQQICPPFSVVINMNYCMQCAGTSPRPSRGRACALLY